MVLHHISKKFAQINGKIGISLNVLINVVLNVKLKNSYYVNPLTILIRSLSI